MTPEELKIRKVVYLDIANENSNPEKKECELLCVRRQRFSRRWAG
jgi:hypothetical protein